MGAPTAMGQRSSSQVVHYTNHLLFSRRHAPISLKLIQISQASLSMVMHGSNQGCTAIVGEGGWLIMP